MAKLEVEKPSEELKLSGSQRITVWITTSAIDTVLKRKNSEPRAAEILSWLIWLPLIYLFWSKIHTPLRLRLAPCEYMATLSGIANLFARFPQGYNPVNLFQQYC